MRGAMKARVLVTGVTLAVAGLLAGQLLDLADGGLKDVAAQPVERDAGASTVFVRDCQQRALAQPTSIRRSCATGSPYWANLQWSRWGGDAATARGSYLSSDCDCGTGSTAQAYPVRIELSGLRTRDGVRHYTTMSVVFPSVRPRAITATGVHYRVTRSGFQQLDGQ